MSDIIINPTQSDADDKSPFVIQIWNKEHECWANTDKSHDLLRHARWDADRLSGVCAGEQYRVVNRFYEELYVASRVHVIGDFGLEQSVTWKYTIPRGWNWEVRIPAVVKKITKKRVLIEAKDKDGEAVQRWVKPEKLEIRKPK